MCNNLLPSSSILIDMHIRCEGKTQALVMDVAQKKNLLGGNAEKQNLTH